MLIEVKCKYYIVHQYKRSLKYDKNTRNSLYECVELQSTHTIKFPCHLKSWLRDNLKNHYQVLAYHLKR